MARLLYTPEQADDLAECAPLHVKHRASSCLRACSACIAHSGEICVDVCTQPPSLLKSTGPWRNIKARNTCHVIHVFQVCHEKDDLGNSRSCDSHTLMEILATISLMTMQRAPYHRSAVCDATCAWVQSLATTASSASPCAI